MSVRSPSVADEGIDIVTLGLLRGEAPARRTSKSMMKSSVWVAPRFAIVAIVIIIIIIII
jgi:hypothetical protein